MPRAHLLSFADQSLLDSLLAPVRNATPDPETQTTRNREDQVRIFAKQLLTALQYMHHRSIAHLDLRPEAILLQDDHLRLADFGQSRHLLRGKATGEIQGTPEFVSPEIVNGSTVTLASDLWSTGALIYVLLAGVSPFLGDNDNETLQNVVNANYSLEIPELSEVSAEAKDFMQKLLLLDHTKRMSVDQALEHDWLADPALKDAKLLTDCLREFKYQHKWLERRVFVQQTPSEQLTQFLDAPHQSVAATQHSAQATAQQAQPYAIYDYNKIKNARPDRPQHIPEIVASNGKKAAEALSRSTLPKHIQEQILQQLQQPAPPPPFYDPRSMSPGQGGQPNGHPQTPPNARAEDYVTGDPRRFSGGHPPRHHLRSPGAQLPPSSPNQLQPMQRSPGAQRRRLEPQAKGETPSQTGRLSPRRPTEKNEQEENIPVPPIELVRGTHRDIQLELATRNLSDISEECSIAGSQASLDDFQDEFRPTRKESRRAKSRSATPHADSESTTPLASPSLTVDSVDPIQQFFGDQEVPQIPELSDPSVPVGAPLFLEGLGGKPAIVSSSGPLVPSQVLSPGTPGSKSPVIHSPKSEHSMTAVIATKYGKQGRAPGMTHEADPMGAEDFNRGEHGASKVKIFTHRDTEFDRLMDDVDRIKAQRQKEKDDLADLEKYRPSNFYKEEEPPRKEIDLDEYPWESNYQIGPETLLIATKGAAFNARVRDYRRELWGDGAPLVRHGILGFRNQEITVRERRRFTDLLREDKDIAKSVEKVDNDLKAAHAGTTRRIRSDLVHSSAPSITKNADGTHAPVFRRRLKDVHFREGAPAAAFECEIIGEPAPQITFYHRGSEIVEDDHHKFEHKGELHRMIIVNPYYTDVGEYSVTGRNTHGQDESSARLLTGDPPAPPSRPEVELASDTEAFITWEAPAVSTSLEGLTYKLESRPAGEDDHFAPWTVISENVESEAVVIKHLNPYGVYQFRVTAKNTFGWGTPSLTSRIIRTHKRGAPKLNLDLLQTEHRFVVLQLPQAMAGRQTGLMEISEEFEEDELAGEAEAAADETGSIASSSGQDPSILNTDDPNSRFQMNREIFRGKFSVVRDAVETKRGVACAVKIRPFDKSEFDLLALCQNENVVKLIAGYKSQNCLLLFTERLYENVFDRFTSIDQYNEEQICLTLRQLASALRWIHFRGVVHMDVQPNNVMFATRRSWFLKLIDFERAVLFEGEPPKKPEPKTLNPEWAAPEMLRPDGQMSEQVDLWGLGMVAFCLLGGFHPFSSEEDTVEEVRENVLKQKCDPNMIPVQASQDALRFVTWALKKDPSRRMRDDEALAHRFLSSDPSMVRRREHIRYPSTRLQRTAARTMKRRSTQLWDPNVIRFTEDRSNGSAHRPNGFPNGHPNGMAPNGRTMEI